MRLNFTCIISFAFSREVALDQGELICFFYNEGETAREGLEVVLVRSLIKEDKIERIGNLKILFFLSLCFCSLSCTYLRDVNSIAIAETELVRVSEELAFFSDPQLS